MQLTRYPIVLLTGAWLALAVCPAHAEGELAPSQDELGEVIIGEPPHTVINEFRVNGQLYMIQVKPRKGPPYYLVDSDGDGNLETRSNELASDLLIPAWVLKRW
jgi:hypothetical protein